MPNAILDPTGTVTSAAKPAAPRAPRLASLDGKRVGLERLIALAGPSSSSVALVKRWTVPNA